MIVLACDPGLTGALSALDHKGLLDLADVPTCDNGQASGSMRRWVDTVALHSLLATWAQRHDFARAGVVCVIERPIPMPSLPAQTIASQFDTFGVLRAALGTWGKVEAANPRDWKKFYGLDADKEGARATAQRLYPDAAQLLKRKLDHNRSDAILLGHWYRKVRL